MDEPLFIEPIGDPLSLPSILDELLGEQTVEEYNAAICASMGLPRELVGPPVENVHG